MDRVRDRDRGRVRDDVRVRDRDRESEPNLLKMYYLAQKSIWWPLAMADPNQLKNLSAHTTHINIPA